MSALPSRRGFLGRLAALPLIGGGVSLIGTPTAVAEPVTRELMLAYSEWLRVERNSLHNELFSHMRASLREASALPFTLQPDNSFYVPPAPAGWHGPLPASARARLVLATAGCSPSF